MNGWNICMSVWHMFKSTKCMRSYLNMDFALIWIYFYINNMLNLSESWLCKPDATQHISTRSKSPTSLIKRDLIWHVIRSIRSSFNCFCLQVSTADAPSAFVKPSLPAVIVWWFWFLSVFQLNPHFKSNRSHAKLLTFPLVFLFIYFTKYFNLFFGRKFTLWTLQLHLVKHLSRFIGLSASFRISFSHCRCHSFYMFPMHFIESLEVCRNLKKSVLNVNHQRRFDLLHVCVSVHYCTITSVDSTLSGQCCQGFGAQRDVASCRKRESRGKAKQDIFRSVRGGGPSPPFCPWGKTHQRKRSLPPFIPPFLPWPCSALLSLGHVLPSDTPLFPLSRAAIDFTLRDLSF